MSSERRKLRPFDVPPALGQFLDKVQLVVGEDEGVFVEASGRRVVSDGELRSGRFALSLERDALAFGDLLTRATTAASEEYGEGAVGLVVVVASGYLKIAEIAVRCPLEDIGRVVSLTEGAPVRAFNSIFHGCDIDAALVLMDDLEEHILRPWRKGTWLSRARFELRTGLDGAGFNVLPLTDDLRSELRVDKKTLRFVDLGETPLEMPATSSVTLYVDSDLLARLNREMSKGWAIAFSDQLAIDVLSAIAIRSVADTNIHDKEWTEIEETLLGSLIAMVDARNSGSDTEIAKRRTELLEELRNQPNRFLARIEGVVEMRDNGKRLVGG